MALIEILNWAEGAYTDTSIHNVPSGLGGGSGAFYIQDNVVTTYKIGTPTKRCGYSQIGATLEASKSITGLHNFRQTAAVQKMLATVDDATSDDTQLFYSTGGAWTEVTAAETAWANKAGINVEMEDFVGYCLMVGWGATDGFLPPASLTGTTFSTSTNVTNMPNAKFIKRYRDRIFIGNCDISATAYPFRVYYSTVPVAGSLTWTVATNWFDVDYSEAITGLESNWDRLMVFTEYSAYMVTGVSPLVKKKVWDVGCSNHRTLKNSGQYMIWANRDGVWMSAGAQDPVNVSAKVNDFIDFSNMTNAFAEVVDEEYHLYLGSVTVNGVSYSNLALILDIPSQTWRWHEYYDGFSIFAKFYTGGQDYLWMGATDGEVHKLGKYTDSTLVSTDDGQPINSWFQTGAISFGTPAERKELKKVFAYADKAQGLFLKARVVDANNQAVTAFKPLGELTKFINEFQVNPDKGNYIQIEGVENGSNEYWSLFGLTFDVNLDGKV